MRNLLRLPVLALALAAGSLAAPTSAAPPEEMRSLFALRAFVPTSEARTTGNVVHQTFRSESEVVNAEGEAVQPGEGPISGRTVNELKCQTIGDTFRCSVIGTFFGTIEGFGTGTATSRQHFTCVVGTFQCQGRFVTISGTDGLAGYRDVGTYRSPTPEGFLAVTARVLSP